MSRATGSRSMHIKRRWGDRRDLNPRQPDPQSGALTGLSYGHHQGTKLGFSGMPVKISARTEYQQNNS